MEKALLETAEEALRDIVGPEGVAASEPLGNHTTFRIGGPAALLVQPASQDQVAAVISWCRCNEVPWRVMGLGSNILASDEGFDGVVVKLAERFASVQVDGCSISAQAGASNEEIARTALENSLTGYEFASGIPGTLGGAAIMNAGAYDGEFKGVAQSVTCLYPDGSIGTVSAEEAQWGYRTSMMMRQGLVVLGATLQLEAGDKAAIKARMDELKARREEKQPLEMPSAGSTFKRPEGFYAGKLIQDAGLMGYRVGGAQVSEKHAGFVVNAGGATAADVMQLIADVQDKVEAMAGVRLEPEIRIW